MDPPFFGHDGAVDLRSEFASSENPTTSSGAAIGRATSWAKGPMNFVESQR